MGLRRHRGRKAAFIVRSKQEDKWSKLTAVNRGPIASVGGPDSSGQDPPPGPNDGYWNAAGMTRIAVPGPQTGMSAPGPEPAGLRARLEPDFT